MIEHAFQMPTQADQNHAWHTNSFTAFSKVVAILTQNNDKIVIQIHVNSIKYKFMQTIMEIQIELSLVWNLDKVNEMRWFSIGSSARICENI